MKFFPALIIIYLLFFSSCSKKPEPTAVEVNTVEVNKEETADKPQKFYILAEGMLKMPPEYLFLVDKKHALPEDFKPSDIVDLDNYSGLATGRRGLKLDRRAAEALVQLSDAAEADGVTLLISSTYRSYSYQRDLFKRYAERDGEEAASRYSAREGTSQHQLGSTVDFGSINDSFAQSEAGIWMGENAGRYGWSLSYPRNMEDETGYRWESWHWRWIGVDAVKMQDDFFDGIQQRLLLYWDENSSLIRKSITEKKQ